MKGVVLDTHAVIWHLSASSKLSLAVASFLEQTVQAGDPLYVPTVSVLEIIYLVEKGRLPGAALGTLTQTLSEPRSDLVSVPLNMAIVIAARQIPREVVPDMPDRIIAATALHLGVPLITRDKQIRAAGIDTIW